MEAAMSYKVQLSNTEMPGKGFIEGYRTAKRAKQVVAMWNAQFEKDGKGVQAKYLGHDASDFLGSQAAS
jgi:hypothetical protein